MVKRDENRRGSWFGSPLPMEAETTLFIFVSCLDVFMTYMLLRRPGFTESNPIARYFLNHWGMKGMIYFKFGMVALLTVVTQIIATKRPRTAVFLLNLGTAVVAFVVIYSLTLLLRHGL